MLHEQTKSHLDLSQCKSANVDLSTIKVDQQIDVSVQSHIDNTNYLNDALKSHENGFVMSVAKLLTSKVMLYFLGVRAITSTTLWFAGNKVPLDIGAPVIKHGVDKLKEIRGIGLNKQTQSSHSNDITITDA